jgi:hypothetical protein
VTLHQTQPPLTARLRLDSDLVRALLVAAALVLVLLAATLLVGVHVAGPSFQITPDPAGAAGLHF